MKPYLAETDPLPTHPTLTHPVTGLPLQAVGLTLSGRPIWPQMGGSQPLGDPLGQPQQTPNTGGIPTLGGGLMQPGMQQGGQPQGGQPQGQPQGGQPQGQPQGGQPQGGQPQGGQPQAGQPQGQPGGQQPQAPVPGPPPGYTPPADRGFPEGVPVERMTGADSEAAAFWRHHARRNQDQLRQYADYDQLKAERDQLKQATQTEMQRAQAEAEARGRQIGASEAGGQVVEAWFRAAAAGRMSEDAINAQLQVLDRTRFMASGQVNQQAIYDHVNVIVGGGMAYPQPQPQVQVPGQPQYAAPGQQPQQYAQGGPVTLPQGYQPQQHWQGYPASYGQQALVSGQPYGAQPYGQPQPGPVQQAPGGWPQYQQLPPQQQPAYGAPGMPGQMPQFRQVPDYGQGVTPGGSQSSPEAGRQKAAARHGGTTRTQQRQGGSGARV